MFPDYEPPEELKDILEMSVVEAADIDPVSRTVHVAIHSERYISLRLLDFVLGLQKSAIAKYENGRVENIKRTVIKQMADVLECSPSYLMGFDAEYSRSDLKEIVISDPNDIKLLNAYYNAPEDVKAGIRSILGLKG